MIIDGWKCEELYPGTDYVMRTATRGSVELCADSDGIELDESTYGYSGYTGRYRLPVNVLTWLMQAVR